MGHPVLGAAGQRGEHTAVVNEETELTSGGYNEPLETESRRPQGSGELPGEVGVLDQGDVQESARLEWGTT